ncbi:glycosyltransferase family 2 protein [Leptolyngbyaceae cyanobacterium CCMR0082]|uniref:Glycosyltransferase family 2 protein n=2 Tax=Adonisia turfae TaxID=2950184 RepID=A0A6M0S4B9_9CYAN|nr:hormogonium polysaccharide biosynthesis glycosyltransferase HpsE [Adonisia turfae]MDV3350447.1 hormogonium polysaccharide biosynthesis glycosyltransferase HpsE [Leptothoe sp. LEGE 181152]NEZ59679.1 glycosyltransferase family 2 protein [Adonisia turfae CCMR0081]NEZ63298.1 glycosyltransferase family 2 protein [Adonisia turfae CCMR0082]
MTNVLEHVDRLVGLRPIFSRFFPEKVGLDFSIAIPTYNGAQRLAPVLESLRWQLNAHDLSWEIIIVDNNSTDNTADIVQKYQQQWDQKAPLRYAFESKQGAAYARQKAIKIATSPLIGFLDDDTLPDMTWLSSAYRFAKKHPEAGVIASRIRGSFETKPPKNFERIAALLALTERGSEPLMYVPQQKVIPPSAGMVVRRQAWLENVPEELVLTGRTGTSMLTGEDTESILHIQRAGWEIWYNPQMRLQHQIPSSRLTRQYLQKLCRGIGLSRYRTRMLSTSPWQRPTMLCLYVMNDIRKILRHCLRYRQEVIYDDVASCELTLYTASLISPFFMAKRSIKKELNKIGLTLNRSLLNR